MSIVQFATGVMMFAVMAAILYVWGYRKASRAPGRLERELRQRLEKTILDLARRPGGVTYKEITQAISGIKVGGHLAGYRLFVNDPPTAAQAMIHQLLARGAIVETRVGGKNVYVLSPEEPLPAAGKETTS